MNMCVLNSLAKAKPDAQLDIGFHQLFGERDIQQVGEAGRLNSLLFGVPKSRWADYRWGLG